MSSKGKLTADAFVQKIKAAKDKSEQQKLGQDLQEFLSLGDEEDLFKIGSALLQIKDYSHANSVIETLKQGSHPSISPNAEELRAFLQFSQGNYNGSLETLQKLIQEAYDPKYLTFQHKIFVKLGRKGEAEKLHQKMLEIQSVGEIHSKAGGETANDSPWEGME